MSISHKLKPSDDLRWLLAVTWPGGLIKEVGPAEGVAAMAPISNEWLFLFRRFRNFRIVSKTYARHLQRVDTIFKK